MGLIRILLALSVVLAHTAEPLPFVGRMVAGPVAVQCFFVLSGFYMALVLHEKYDAAAPFYWNRFSRIFSGYWVALAFALVLALIARSPALDGILAGRLPPDALSLVLFSNLFIFGSDGMFFLQPSESGLQFVTAIDPAAEHLWDYMLISPTWTLAVELAFYIVAPFVVRSVPRLVILGAASLALKTITTGSFGNIDPWTYRFAPSEFFFFAAGAVSYKALPLARRLPATLGWLLLGAVVAALILHGRAPPRFASGIFPLLAVAAPFVFAAFEKLQTTNNARLWFLGDREIGEASYMLYLCHVPVIAFLGATMGAAPSPFLAMGASVFASLLLHRASKRFDTRMRRLATRLLARPVARQSPLVQRSIPPQP